MTLFSVWLVSRANSVEWYFLSYNVSLMLLLLLSGISYSINWYELLHLWFLILFITEVFNMLQFKILLVKTPFSFSFFSGSFVEDFNFVWLKMITTRQEWFCEWAAITVASWWIVGPSKICCWICGWWGVRSNINIVPSSKCRSVTRATVCGISQRIGSLRSWWLECYWSPAWIVHQWKQKSGRTGQVATTGN